MSFCHTCEFYSDIIVTLSYRFHDVLIGEVRPSAEYPTVCVCVVTWCVRSAITFNNLLHGQIGHRLTSLNPLTLNVLNRAVNIQSYM